MCKQTFDEAWIVVGETVPRNIERVKVLVSVIYVTVMIG